jgi:hypothetical protein
MQGSVQEHQKTESMKPKIPALRRILPILFFLLCLAFFIERGTYRAIRYSTTGDFSTLYAAARCWLHGEDAYSASALKHELETAGASDSIVRDQDINVSVYLPSAMPLSAPVAALPWRAANPAWCLLALVAFGASVWLILRHLELQARAKWIIAGLAVLFSPTYVGLFDGNPSVLCISCVALAICLALDRRPWTSGVLLGVALCFKPQIAFCALCVFILWRCWRPLITAFAIACAAGITGAIVASSFGTNWQWLGLEQHNVALSFAPGGTSDPTPSGPVAWQMLNGQTIASYAIHNTTFANITVWLFAAALAIGYLWLRTKDLSPSKWRDISFFAALTLIITYHRYYDAQLLLLTIPLLVTLWKRNERVTVALLCLCLLALAFPQQSVFARALGERATTASFTQLVLLRQQPLAVLAMALILAFARRPSDFAHS